MCQIGIMNAHLSQIDTIKFSIRLRLNWLRPQHPIDKVFPKQIIGHLQHVNVSAHVPSIELDPNKGAIQRLWDLGHVEQLLLVNPSRLVP